MYKKVSMLCALSAVLLFCSGCDFLRKMAGRPTSEDIEAKREVIALEEARHQARLDSLAVVEKQAADSLALLDSIRRSGSVILGTGRLGGVAAASLHCRYYIIIGAFSNADNAKRLAEKAQKAGVEATRIPCTNGYTAVSVFPSNSLAEVYSSLLKVKGYEFCPDDAWILVNE